MAANNNTNLINYTNRDFQKLQQDLINYAKTRHSDKLAYINENSPDIMYIQLLAYMGDSLNYQIDKSFNEGFRLSAQNRESLVRIANDNGYYNFHAKPSTLQAVVSIKIPYTPNANGSVVQVDQDYLLSIASGMKIQSTTGVYFECLDEINFADAKNRTIIPNLDSNNQLIDFTIEKTAVFTAGETKVQRYFVGEDTVKPFLEILVNDKEVTEVVSVVTKIGDIYDVPADDEFRDLDNAFVEVRDLAVDKIFIDIDPTNSEINNLINAYSDMTIHYGEWVNKPKRYIVRRDKNDNCFITFGSTLVNYDYWNQLIGNYDIRTLANFSLSQILNNMSLGQVPEINNTLFIKYRTGAGIKTNILQNQELTVIDKRFTTAPTSSNLTILSGVRNSLKIRSTTPAIGGLDSLSNEEIRNITPKVFSSNDRAVTYEDVKALIQEMPSKFGQPYRISYEEIKPSVMNYDQVKNFLNLKLAEILTETSNYNREIKINEIKDYINLIPNQLSGITTTGILSTLQADSINMLDAAPSLWIGEKCRLHVLGINQDKQPVTTYKDDTGVWRFPNELLKLNIKNWLVEKRVIGDWIDIVDARVVNFQIKFKILADKKNKQKVLIDCLTKLRNYFSIENWQINQPIFIANVSTILQEIDGVINVIDIKFYNIFDKDLDTSKVYSPAEIGRYRNNSPYPENSFGNKFLMNSVNNIIQSYPDTLLSIKDADFDIFGEAI